jgi:putative tryptophan/tyrosine transport system substrate-binding protein
MKRKVLWIALCWVLTAIFLVACTTVKKEPYTIGVVNFLPVMDSVLDGFKDGMTEFEYVDGETIQYMYDGPVDGVELLDEMAQNLVAQHVDMLLSFSTLGTAAAQRATAGTEIPVVFVPVTDPVSNQFVADLSEPGGNLTGITNGGSEGRRLEWLLEIAPNIEQIYILYNPGDGSAISALETTRRAAAEFGIQIIAREVNNEEEIIANLADIPAEIDAIFLLPDILTVARISKFNAAAIERKIPLSGATISSVHEGALIAFGADFYTSGKQAARLADLIIRGSNPGDLPVETAEFFLVINLKTAVAIDLEVPDSILDQAHDILR